MTATTAKLEINFNNYIKTGQEEFGTINNGISIYNQRYSLSKALKTSLTLAQIKTILQKVIKGELVEINPITSNPFDRFDYEPSGTNSSIYLLKNNQIMIFECKRSINGQDYYSYYCYFKDGNITTTDKDGNVWLIFITLANVQTESVEETIPYPVIFDLQDNLEPTFTRKQVEGSSTQFTTDSCSTGNFDIKTVGASFNYADITLKNTSFNLSYDEKKEVTATIIPIGGFKAQN